LKPNLGSAGIDKKETQLKRPFASEPDDDDEISSSHKTLTI